MTQWWQTRSAAAGAAQANQTHTHTHTHTHIHLTHICSCRRGLALKIRKSWSFEGTAFASVAQDSSWSVQQVCEGLVDARELLMRGSRWCEGLICSYLCIYIRFVQVLLREPIHMICACITFHILVSRGQRIEQLPLSASCKVSPMCLCAIPSGRIPGPLCVMWLGDLVGTLSQGVFTSKWAVSYMNMIWSYFICEIDRIPLLSTDVCFCVIQAYACAWHVCMYICMYLYICIYIYIHGFCTTANFAQMYKDTRGCEQT
jgi:hypothetical protein